MSSEPKVDEADPASPRSLAPAAPSERLPYVLDPTLSGAWSEVLAVLRTEAGYADTKESRASLLHAVAELEEILVGDQPASARGYLTAYNARSSFRPPLDALVRLYRQRASFSNLGKLLDAEVRSAPNAVERAEALTLRGELSEDYAADRDSARASYRAAVESDAEHALGWYDLERLAAARADADERLEALWHLAGLTRDPARRAALLFERAEGLEARGDSGVDAALDCLREAAMIPTARWRAHECMERVALRAGRRPDVAEAMESRAALAAMVARGEADAPSVGASVADLPDRAAAGRIGAWLRLSAARVRLQASDAAVPIHAAIAEAIALDDDVRTRVAAMVLGDLAGEIEESAVHAAWLLERGHGDPAAQAALHFRCAERSALAGESTAAAESLREALRCDPSSSAARAALIEQASAVGDATTLLEQYDRLAAAAGSTSDRGAVLRAGALASLLLRSDLRDAVRRLREALELDPADVLSRRLLLSLLRRTAERDDGRTRAERAAERIAAIDALLPKVVDEDERAALLLERLFDELLEGGAMAAAASTAERLADAAPTQAWPMQTAASLWAAAGSLANASRCAERAARASFDRSGASGGWSALAARWAWAAGDEGRARVLAGDAHALAADDRYLTALRMTLCASAHDGAGLLETAERAAEAEASGGARWLVVAALWLQQLGAPELCRRALEGAVSHAPADATVLAGVLAATTWRDDPELRLRLLSRDDLDAEGDTEVLAARIEEVLLHLVVEHDAPGAAQASRRIAPRGAPAAAAAALVAVIAHGAASGAESEAAQTALRELSAALPSDDPARASVETEVLRARAADGASMPSQAGDASAATRVQGLVDVVRRDAVERVPAALLRVAELEDADAKAPLLEAALAGFWAGGRSREARSVADRVGAGSLATVVRSELPPGGFEGARAHGDALAARAGIAEAATRTDWLAQAANWHSLGGDSEAAMTEARAVLAVRPSDLGALDVLRVSGRRLGRWDDVASACEALGGAVLDAHRAATYFEEAGIVALQRLDDAPRAERSFRAVLERAPGRDVSFRLLRRLLEASGDVAGLEVLVGRRIDAVSAPDARSALLWDQARLRRALGLRQGALESATAVLRDEPAHVAALALVAEIHAVSGRLREAATALVALGSVPAAPESQRRAALLGAAEILERRLSDHAGALDVFGTLESFGWLTEPLALRAVALATSSGDHEAALRFAQAALRVAASDEARIAAHLRIIGIHAEGRRDPAGAYRAAAAALERFPWSVVLLRATTAHAPDEQAAPAARRSIEAMRVRALQVRDFPAVLADLAGAAVIAGDAPLARAAERLGAWCGGGGRPSVLPVPSKGSLRDAATQLRVRGASDRGRAGSVVEHIERELLPFRSMTLDALRLGRGDRVRGPSAMRAAVTPFATACGVGEFELYAGGGEQQILVLPDEPLVLVLGSRVALDSDTGHRFRLVMELVLGARGLGGWTYDERRRLELRLIASLLTAGVTVPAQGLDAAALRSVAKLQSRRVRKLVAEYARTVPAAEVLHELMTAADGMRWTARRSALAMTGAVDAAIADAAREDGTAAGATPEGWGPAVRDIMTFAASDALVGAELELGVDHG